VSKLGRYIQKYGHPFALRHKNGKGIIEVRFNDGYVTIYSRQPGTSRFEQEIHISRKAWYKLLNSPQLKEVSRMMEGPSFDRYKAERKYQKEEAILLQELREGKREARKARQDLLRARRVQKARARRLGQS
jgi:hypothetical protein